MLLLLFEILSDTQMFRVGDDCHASAFKRSFVRKQLAQQMSCDPSSNSTCAFREICENSPECANYKKGTTTSAAAWYISPITLLELGTSVFSASPTSAWSYPEVQRLSGSHHGCYYCAQMSGRLLSNRLSVMMLVFHSFTCSSVSECCHFSRQSRS